VRQCPRCGAQVRCHRFDELESEVPEQLKEIYKLLEEGNYKGAKSIARNVAERNRQVTIPGVDDELRALFKKIKVKRDEGRTTLPAS